MENENEKETSDETVKLPIVIKLKKPINDGEKEITEFKIVREPNGVDWSSFNIQNATIADFQRVGARLMNLPLPVVKKADTQATFRLAEVIGSFLE